MAGTPSAVPPSIPIGDQRKSEQDRPGDSWKLIIEWVALYRLEVRDPGQQDVIVNYRYSAWPGEDNGPDL